MKQHLQQLIAESLANIQQQVDISIENLPDIAIDHTRDKQFGDYACNIALMLAKPLKRKPREIAELIVNHLPDSGQVSKVEIAGPGFINFYLNDSALYSVIEDVLDSGKDFGHCEAGANAKVNLEFVSANPTGPLHVGHGRSVAYGAALANLLSAIGYDVHKEYYVNDAGRQMDILTASIWLRYLELCGESFAFPRNGYKGDYIIDISKHVLENHKQDFHWPAEKVFADIPQDETDDGQGDKEAHIDGLIDRCKSCLGETGFDTVLDIGLQHILGDIKEDLAALGVHYDHWYSERSLFENNAIWHSIDKLKASGHAFEKDNCLWFRATDFGDDKDRVLIRQNGKPTYFASDIAYHLDKFERGAQQIIDVLGADHHGYVVRIRSALQAMGIEKDKMAVDLVQFAVLYRNQQKVQMSTRSGSFITLRELRDEVGKDATRFFYVMRKKDQHLDFDLDLAKSHSHNNPVYYIQYAHARICSVTRQLADKQLNWDKQHGLQSLDLLVEAHEKALVDRLTRYPELLLAAANSHEPHTLAQYLKDLANDLHSYYNAHQFIVDEQGLRNARLCLIAAVRQVIANGLELLGVSAPEEMH